MMQNNLDHSKATNDANDKVHGALVLETPNPHEWLMVVPTHIPLPFAKMFSWVQFL
jgi:hypothetical protein